MHPSCLQNTLELTKNDRQELIDSLSGTGPFQMAEYRQAIYSPATSRTFWRGTPLMPQVVVDLGSGGTGDSQNC
jgi:cationic peptide transport system substrate-binding protein